MITAHPSLLRELIERCEVLRRRLAADGNAETARQLEDATYTLCVTTGTRRLDTALMVARRQMADGLRRDQPPAIEIAALAAALPQDARHDPAPQRRGSGTEPCTAGTAETANRPFQPRK